jgi:ACS family pantothenate transporter-like MFS transporter
MSLWLKSEPTKWSIPQINTLPTIINIISAFSSWFGTSLAGTLSVWKCFSIPQACLIFSLTVLTVWNVPQGLKFAAFYVGGLSGATSPILYSWLNTQMRDAPESRAFSELPRSGRV